MCSNLLDYQRITDGLVWKGLKSSSSPTPLPWAGTPSTRPGRSELSPPWPWMLPGMGQGLDLGLTSTWTHAWSCWVCVFKDKHKICPDGMVLSGIQIHITKSVGAPCCVSPFVWLWNTNLVIFLNGVKNILGSGLFGSLLYEDKKEEMCLCIWGFTGQLTRSRMSTRRQRSLTLILKKLRSVGNNFPSFLPDVSHFFFIPAVGFRMTSSTWFLQISAWAVQFAKLYTSAHVYSIFFSSFLYPSLELCWLESCSRITSARSQSIPVWYLWSYVSWFESCVLQAVISCTT